MRLFLFSIGGSGARVLKSLLFTLSSGVQLNGISEVVPIIIDPDKSNGDLLRTEEILKLYTKCRVAAKSKTETEGFFRTKVTSLGELLRQNNGSQSFGNDQFTFDIPGTQDLTFGEFIGYPELQSNDPNKALIELLFSDRNLESKMNVGFKGNPNLGSVVLNQFKELDLFKGFASVFNKSDKVFIISSIFGGTGASGFPLLVKNIRGATSDIPNHGSLNDSVIGAVSVLPYFNLEPNENSDIDSGTFVSKTKSALYYYEKNITGNNSLNALYYIGDSNLSDPYKNNEGAKMQKNDAHFVEFAAGLALLDFCNQDNLKTENGQAVNPLYSEYGVNKNEVFDSLNGRDLGVESKEVVFKHLSKLGFLSLFLKNKLARSVSNKVRWSQHGKPKLNSDYFKSDFQQTAFEPFMQHFATYMKELATNSVAFDPFNEEVETTRIFDFINDHSAKPSLYLKNFATIDFYLNVAERESRSNHSNQKFFEVFYTGISKMLKTKYENNG